MTGLPSGSVCPECGEPEPLARRPFPFGLLASTALVVSYLISVALVGSLFVSLLSRAYAYSSDDSRTWGPYWNKSQIVHLGLGLAVLAIVGFLGYRRRRRILAWPLWLQALVAIVILLLSLILFFQEAYEIRY